MSLAHCNNVLEMQSSKTLKIIHAGNASKIADALHMKAWTKLIAEHPVAHTCMLPGASAACSTRLLVCVAHELFIPML